MHLLVEMLRVEKWNQTPLQVGIMSQPTRRLPAAKRNVCGLELALVHMASTPTEVHDEAAAGCLVFVQVQFLSSKHQVHLCGTPPFPSCMRQSVGAVEVRGH